MNQYTKQIQKIKQRCKEQFESAAKLISQFRGTNIIFADYTVGENIIATIKMRKYF